MRGIGPVLPAALFAVGGRCELAFRQFQPADIFRTNCRLPGAIDALPIDSHPVKTDIFGVLQIECGWRGLAAEFTIAAVGMQLDIGAARIFKLHIGEGNILDHAVGIASDKAGLSRSST